MRVLPPLFLAVCTLFMVVRPGGRRADPPPASVQDAGPTDVSRVSRLAGDRDEAWRRFLRVRPRHELLTRLIPALDPELYGRLTATQQESVLNFAASCFAGEVLVGRCWAPDTPPDLIKAHHAAEEAARADAPGGDDPAPATHFRQRWTTTATNGRGQNVRGRPVTITWSIVPDGTPIPSASGIGDSDDPSDLREWLATIYPDSDTGAPGDQPWFPVVSAVFDNLSARTGVIYVYEPADDGATLGSANDGTLGVRGDVRIGGHRIDGTSRTLAYNYYPNTGDMVIDTDDTWFNNTSNTSIRLANTIEHEAGHGLGLEHICPSDDTKIMEASINTGFRGIQFDATYNIQRQYGDYYEHHSSDRDNDTFAHASPLTVESDVLFSVEWLSLDGTDDTDYFSFPVAPDSRLTVRVTPSHYSYAQDGQDRDGGCPSNPDFFESHSLQNLSLELIAPDQSTVLTSSTANPAGQPEEIVEFVTSREGTHYLRITGTGTDDAQLYRLEVEVEAPDIALALTADTILEESFAPANGVVDPGETVLFSVTLDNSGTLAATNVTAALTGPAGFTGFTTIQDYGTLAAAGSVARPFVFGLQGACGAILELDLTMTADGGILKKIPLSFTLGESGPVRSQDFEGNGSSFPPTWSSTVVNKGSGWSLSTEHSASGIYSVFAADVGSPGLSNLISPSIDLGTSGGTLSFSHSYDTESGFDGGVLEISLNGGAWQDIVAAGGTFTSGAYDRNLSNGFSNPLPGRDAWSGNSGGFVTSSVTLPIGFGGQPVRFRWRLGHDQSLGVRGWNIDDVILISDYCDQSAPAVRLELIDGTASEFDPLDTARIALSTELPPIAALPVTLVSSGSGTLGTDTSVLTGLAVSAGETSSEFSIHALPDSEIEGPESLLLSIDPSSGVLPIGSAEITVTILDSPYGSWASTSLGLVGPITPREDFDRDGSLNLEEFAWQTDATSAFSQPDLRPQLTSEGFRIEAPAIPPTGVRVRAEASTDLHTWTDTGIEPLANGFQLSPGDPRAFLRLVYELLPEAP